MIKKIFHLLCCILVGLLWSCILGAVFWQILRVFFHIDMLSIKTYSVMSDYWNNGGIFRGKDLLIFFIIFLYFPLCLYGWNKIRKYKFSNLIIVPLNWFFNRGLDNYHTPEVNIKNLKIEEKKSLEQVVGERLETEKKKLKRASTGDLRKEIIKRIEEK